MDNHFGYIQGCMSVLGQLVLRINLLFWGEIVSSDVFYELSDQTIPTISLGNLRLGVPFSTVRNWDKPSFAVKILSPCAAAPSTIAGGQQLINDR